MHKRSINLTGINDLDSGINWHDKFNSCKNNVFQNRKAKLIKKISEKSKWRQSQFSMNHTHKSVHEYLNQLNSSGLSNPSPSGSNQSNILNFKLKHQPLDHLNNTSTIRNTNYLKNLAREGAITSLSNNTESKLFKPCIFCIEKDMLIVSLTEQLEDLQNQLSDACLSPLSLFGEIASLQNDIRQNDIKFDLELSFLKTKVGLLEETLNNRTNEFKNYDTLKSNNTDLLQLLEKYDSKLSQMQDDIDVRDLRINDLIETYQDGTNDLNLDVIEARVKFLINLLEKCRELLENEALNEDDLGEFREKIEQIRRENAENQSNGDTVEDRSKERIRAYSQSNEIRNKSMQIG